MSWRACVTPGDREVNIFFIITPPEEPVLLRGSGGGHLLLRHASGGAYVAPGAGRWVSSSPSRRRRSMCRSGDHEVGIFFLVTPPEEHTLLRGSVGGNLLLRQAFGGAYAALGVGRWVPSSLSRRRMSMCHWT